MPSGPNDVTTTASECHDARITAANFCEYGARNNLSTRYDPAIVYAVDENFTRGSYLVLARGFHSYINESNLPGCVVVVGYDHSSSYESVSHKLAVGTFGEDADGRTIDLGGAQVPYIPLSSTLEYPIFEFKRYTGYPTVAILITLHSSRLKHTLSCDGRIDVHPRDSKQRSCKRISEALGHVAECYLNDLFYDDRRRRGFGLRTESAASLSA